MLTPLLHSQNQGLLQFTAPAEKSKASFLAVSFRLCSPPLGCILHTHRSVLLLTAEEFSPQCCAPEALGVPWGLEALAQHTAEMSLLRLHFQTADNQTGLSSS